jgi:hypothetical protein
MRQVNGEEFLQEVENYYEREEGMRTIDITPKWEGMMRVMLAVLENPKASAESKQSMREELISLGRWVDGVNEERKKSSE